MTERLAKTLVSQDVVDNKEIEEALQRQVLYGGSLDTNLLEASVVSESVLLPALGQAYGLPHAGKHEIDAIGAHIPRLFPVVFAETYHLVPYRLADSDFGVLVNGPPDEQLLTRIRERLQLTPSPTVTTEARLHYAMHRLYGTRLLPRFESLLCRLDGSAPTSLSSPDAGDQHVLSWGLSGARIVPSAKRGPERRPGLDTRGHLSRLEGATKRDAVVEVLLEAALGIFEFAALFLVQAEQVVGWRATEPEATQRVVRITLPVELPSVFQTIYATGGHYLGPLPQNSVNTKLLTDMGRQPPRTSLLAPIAVAGKLAVILYADNGGRGIPSKRVASLLLLTQRAGLRLEDLIRQRKAENRGEPAAAQNTAASTPEPTPPEKEVAWGTQDAAPEAEPEPGEVTAAQVVHGGDLREAIEVGADDYESIESLQETDSQGSGPEYVAFADIDESPDEAIDDWEDVLLETVESGEAKDGPPPPQQQQQSFRTPPAVSWQDVIQEAQRANETFQPTLARSIEVAGTRVDEREILLDTLDAQDPDARRAAVERLRELGSALDEAIRERFPGSVGFDPLAQQAQVPPFPECTGLTQLLAARGQDAATVVLPFLESADAVQRFFAIYFFLAIPTPAALTGLGRRLYDTEPRNRYLAAEALRAYAREPGYRQIVQGLRDQLKVPILENQLATVQVLGQLRDPSAVPSLIPLVVAPHQGLAAAARSALASVCLQAFGADVASWADWWQTHYDKPRPAWLIESLRHENPTIVRMAHAELQLLTGYAVPYDPRAPLAQREAATRAWEQWWQRVTTAQQPLSH